MNRSKFITMLHALWDKDPRKDARLDDLLRDAAELGLEGAYEALADVMETSV